MVISSARKDFVQNESDAIDGLPLSKTVKSIAYNGADNTMFVVFHNGRSYKYKYVPEATWKAASEAESIGKFIHAVMIKNFVAEEVEYKEMEKFFADQLNTDSPEAPATPKAGDIYRIGNIDTQPLGEKPLSMDEEVFQALGEASTCWEKMEGTGVFQSTRAEEIGNRLMKRIDTDVAHAVGVLARALKADPELFYSWQSNIAMPFQDEYKSAIEKLPMGIPSDQINLNKMANKAAKYFLNLLISQTEKSKEK